MRWIKKRYYIKTNISDSHNPNFKQAQNMKVMNKNGGRNASKKGINQI